MADIGRLLVPAGAALTDLSEVPPSIGRLIDGADEVFVVTRALTSRMEWLVSDVDRARHAADERLDAILGHAGWQERGLVERVQRIAQRPITVFEIDESGHAVDRSVIDT